MNAKSVAPYLRRWAQEERAAKETGYYRKRPRTPYLYYAWLSIIIAAVLALTMTSHHEQDMTAAVNRQAVVSRWDGNEDAGTWVQRELFVLKECKNPDRIYQQWQEARR